MKSADTLGLRVLERSGCFTRIMVRPSVQTSGLCQCLYKNSRYDRNDSNNMVHDGSSGPGEYRLVSGTIQRVADCIQGHKTMW